MSTKFNFRSVVFKRAYLIVKETGLSFSEALTEAWRRYRDYRDNKSQELAKRINGFDYYYNYSDDSRVYNKWSNERTSIMNELGELPSLFISSVSALLQEPKNINQFIITY